ncbi:MAG: DUF1294 domain-containing protein [Bacillota bacterium]
MDLSDWLWATGYLAAINLIGLIVMYVDKRRASARRRRVPTRVLWSLAMVGGAFGLYLGMHWRRHKTAKPAFRIGLPLLSAFYLVVFLWYTYRFLISLA